MIAIRVENLRELNASIGYRGADALLEQLGRCVEGVSASHRAIAGRDSGRVVAIASPAGEHEAIAAEVREGAPPELELSISSFPWSEALDADELVARVTAA